MGTRHQQIVINKNGERKLSQYGQWDGNPENQGNDIFNFLKTADLIKYQENLDKLKLMDEENAKRINKFIKSVADKKLRHSEEREELEANPEYYAISRDCGSVIHNLIEEGKVTYVKFIEDEEANYWCAGFYTIDFQNNTFTSKYRGKELILNIDNLGNEEEYLNFFKNDNS